MENVCYRSHYFLLQIWYVGRHQPNLRQRNEQPQGDLRRCPQSSRQWLAVNPMFYYDNEKILREEEMV